MHQFAISWQFALCLLSTDCTANLYSERNCEKTKITAVDLQVVRPNAYYPRLCCESSLNIGFEQVEDSFS